MPTYQSLLEFGSLEVLLERNVAEEDSAFETLEVRVFSEGRITGEVVFSPPEVPWLLQGLSAADEWGHAGFPEEAGNGATWRGGNEGEWGPDQRYRWVIYLLGERRVHLDFEDGRVCVWLRSLALDQSGLRQVAVTIDTDDLQFQELIRKLAAGYSEEPVGWHRVPEPPDE